MITGYSPFRVAILAFFGIAGLASLFFIASYQSSQDDDRARFGSRVVIWGTLDSAAVNRYLDEIKRTDRSFEVVTYRQLDSDTFDAELIEALAERRGPDLLLLDAERLVKHRTRLAPFSYESYTVRYIKDTYVDGAEVFALSTGLYALPFAVDPLVMFWNRDLFASNGFAVPPSTWETTVNETVPVLTERTSTRQIRRSAIAFGEYSNVNHAKKILLMLSLQSGSDMVRESGGRYSVNINTSATQGGNPLETSLDFFTRFSNSNSEVYSWNNNLPTDRNAFSAGDLALYFAPGSEAVRIQERNPNLNFDIEFAPQGASATLRRTQGNFYGFAVVRFSNNLQGSFGVAGALSSPVNAPVLARQLDMAPVHRWALTDSSHNRFQQVLNQSALYSYSWLDPNPFRSDSIFRIMVEDITSGRSRTSPAASDATARLQNLLR